MVVTKEAGGRGIGGENRKNLGKAHENRFLRSM